MLTLWLSTKQRNTENTSSIPFRKTAQILLRLPLCTSYGIPALLQRTNIHARPATQVRTEGLQRECQLGRKLLRISLINCSSVLRTFVMTKEHLYAINAVLA